MSDNTIMEHDVVFDTTGTGHLRFTCKTCPGEKTIVRQPYMNMDQWRETLKEFLAAHSPTILRYHCGIKGGYARALIGMFQKAMLEQSSTSGQTVVEIPEDLFVLEAANARPPLPDAGSLLLEMPSMSEEAIPIEEHLRRRATRDSTRIQGKRIPEPRSFRKQLPAKMTRGARRT